MRRGQCITCGKAKTQFVKKGVAGGSFLNTLMNKLPFEMHLPGHNFTGPGTKLYKRLNPDGTPMEWSIPINRVDNTAYHHDLCYSKHDDTRSKNEGCDNTMLGELNGIVNPTLRERNDKSIVGKTHQRVGPFYQKIYKKIKFINELAEELHKPISKKFDRRRVKANGIDEI